jgi:glutathione S-transferase
MAAPILFLGNKNYSSWSMRPWLALRWGGLAFEEKVLALGMDGYGMSKISEILAVSPSGRVPALKLENGATIWDSLAICEWAAEQKPGLWPRSPEDRAIARSVVCEMHAGFAMLRRDLPMNVRRRAQSRALSSEVAADVTRIQNVWESMREQHGSKGPFLFGDRTIADAFYAPVCTRFRTYNVSLSPAASAYCDAIFADPDFKAWESAAEKETWAMPSVDTL